MSTDKSTQYFDDLDPKALRYAEKLNAAEQIIVDAMPHHTGVDGQEGDVAAARYLVDRMYGRARASPMPQPSTKPRLLQTATGQKHSTTR